MDVFPDLKKFWKSKAGILSGGQKQMLAIARSLMSEPKLLMIDEPSLGIGPKIMAEIYEAIKTFPKEGVTVLLSEQNVQYALEISDRGYVLQDGHVVLEGSSDTLLNSDLVRKAYVGI
jgi:branched-chain amino acid transport system ATP-binding protein